jgi:diguanylate cyclase (GGDEF)-like protein
MSEQVRAALAPKRPVKRLVAIIFMVALCFCAICGKVLLDARRATWDRAAQAAAGLVAGLESDISRNIESYDLSLRAVIDNLAYPEIIKISPELRQLVLFDRSAMAKHLEAIEYVDENGIVRLDSRTPFPKPVSRSEREYFQFHKNSKVFKLHVSAPTLVRDTGNRVITISRRLSNQDGSFAGVVAASVRLVYFQQLFKNAALQLEGGITLLRTDGIVLARWPSEPAMLGRDLYATELFSHLAAARSGRFETVPVDTTAQRLVVYSQIGELPLVIQIGQSTDALYAQWRSYAITIGIVMLLLCAVSVALASYLIREMGQRNASEARLAMLAATDGLTGLSNRRSLNDAIDREWQRAMRDRLPLALAMCDTDLFKSYNDRYGHQVGDKLLQAIAAAMRHTIKPGAGVAARFGGDEFAILLPSMSAKAAAEVADEVRSRVGAVCDEQGIPRSYLSIGIASVVPESGEDPSSLMAAADQALYRAKELGRDRIELASRPPPKLALVASAPQVSAA